MTAAQATHLIEQFAAQCPLAIWILDAGGTAIFANRKLHELFDIPSDPSGALGFNLFEDPGVEALNLAPYRDRLENGEHVELSIEIEEASEVPSEVRTGRSGPLYLHVVAYPLFSTSQEIEHYVVFLEDVTETQASHRELEHQLKDVRQFLRSRDSRKERLEELLEEAGRLEEEIRALGGET